MSRANYPETILNNPNGTAIYIIDRESHKILYFNDCVREVVPEATVAIHKPDRHDAKTIPIISMSANTFPDDIRLA